MLSYTANETLGSATGQTGDGAIAVEFNLEEPLRAVSCSFETGAQSIGSMKSAVLFGSVDSGFERTSLVALLLLFILFFCFFHHVDYAVKILHVRVHFTCSSIENRNHRQPCITHLCIPPHWIEKLDAHLGREQDCDDKKQETDEIVRFSIHAATFFTAEFIGVFFAVESALIAEEQSASLDTIQLELVARGTG